jgi:ketosteroid isomerase-like protein
MSDAWAHDDSVTAMHPIGGHHDGWDAIRSSFDQFAQLSGGGTITLREQQLRVLGDTAYETGIESGRMTLAGEPVTFEHRVTNIYHRDGDGWKMVHHHSDVSPGIVEILSRQPAQA